LKKEEEYIQEFARIFQAKLKCLIEKAVKNKKDYASKRLNPRSYSTCKSLQKIDKQNA
jgi:hypothetical protein